MTYFHCQSAEMQNIGKGGGKGVRGVKAIKRAANADDRKGIGSVVIAHTVSH